MFHRVLFSALTVCAAGAVTLVSAADLALGNGRFRLTVGDDARVRSLKLLASGEECAAASGEIPLFTVTQERPFDNELKLIHPNRRTTFPANRVREETTGGVGEGLRRLVVGFEIVPYEATVEVKETDAYLAFRLVGFTTNYYDHCKLLMDKPPVAGFRVLQLPVRDRRFFGNWLNASWDEKGAVAVVSTSPYPDIAHERCAGYRILTADLVRGQRLANGTAALIAANGREDFLDCMDRLERDYGLPLGVESRRKAPVNASIYHGLQSMAPGTIDEHIRYCRQGGFRLMCLPSESVVKNPGGEWWVHGDYDWRPDYPNRSVDLTAMLGKIKAAGIRPGFHFLHTHIGLRSRYVTPVADPRLNLTRRFTLARPLTDATNVTELVVQEPTWEAPVRPKVRVLKFGGELFSYESYTEEPPYRFLGVKRGVYATRVTAHARGEIGGVLDVSEYGSPSSCYLDQNSDLQEEVAAKIAAIYNCGFEFAYFDGSEGVNAPCGFHVSNAQYRQWKLFRTKPAFCEGAAKTHFGWHILSGANAFDCFLPGEFKRMTAKFPFGQAPLAWQDMTRCNFGWWFFWAPDRTKKSELRTGTQMDMWEYGSALSYAWDCPTTVLVDEKCVRQHPRAADILETMRRWEDVRARQLLTPAEKESLKDVAQEHHLYLNEQGGYELLPIRMLPEGSVPEDVRGFTFIRRGRRFVAYWNMYGEGEMTVPWGEDGRSVTLKTGALTYRELPDGADI